jgi:hypothetical protein
MFLDGARFQGGATMSTAIWMLLLVMSTAQERTVRGVMQPHFGAPAEEVEVQVHSVPVDPPSVPAAEADLSDDDLVLGVVVEGKAMAYPVRFLALSEVVDDRVGNTPLAPSW